MLRFFPLAMVTAILCTLALSGCSSGGGGSKGAGTGLTGSVTGKIAASSLPVGGGTVTASLDGKNISSPIAADGTFTLANVPPGVYTLVVQSAQAAGDVVVVVSAGSVTNVGAIDLVGAGQVSGLVSDSVSGSPIAGATVTVSDASTASATADEPPLPIRTTSTDGAGSYVMDGLPAGGYLVTVSRHGYTTATLEVNVSAGVTTVGDVRLGAITIGTGSMQGTVTETNADGSSSPLGGVFVILSSISDGPVPITSSVPPTATSSSGHSVIIWPIGPISPDYFAYTADDGTYSITGIPAGSYTASAIRPGFQTASQSVTITLAEASKVNFSLALYQIPTGTVTGTVTDASTHAPISGAVVTAIIYGPTPLSGGNSRARPSAVALPYQPSTFNVTATTDASGNYSLVVPTSTYAIFFAASGYESAQQVVSVTNGSTTTANIGLTPAANQTATISGTVTLISDSGGAEPAPGATVTIKTSPLLIPGGTNTALAPLTYTTTTDENGKYETTIPIGVYVAYASTGNAQSPPVFVRLFNNMTEDMVMSPGNFVPPPPVQPILGT